MISQKPTQVKNQEGVWGAGSKEGGVKDWRKMILEGKFPVEIPSRPGIPGNTNQRNLRDAQ